MKSQKQLGFSALEGLLILIIIGIVGFTGYYVYHARNNTNSLYNSASNTIAANKTPKAKPAPDPTANWQTITSLDSSYTLKAPQTWVSLTCDGSTSTVYLASTKANLAVCNSDNSGEASFSVMADQSAKTAPAKDPTYQSYSSVQATVNGVSGFKTTYKTAADAVLGADTTYVVYSFLSGNKSFYATYVELSGLPAGDAAAFDQIVQTWKF